MMVGLRVPRIEPDQKVIIDDGALEIAGGAIGLSAVEDRSGMVRIGTDDLIEIADGAIGVSLLQVGETAADEILGLFRIDLERAIEVGDGGVDIALLAVCLGAAAERRARASAHFVAIVVQIALIDIVFSLDSVFTAVGLARPDQVMVMAAAIITSILVMMWLSKPIFAFIDTHPTVKVLALSFLILVGLALVGEGMDFHIPKGYLYFAMAFSVLVEMINIRLRKLLDARHRRGH